MEDTAYEQGALLASIRGLITDIRRSRPDMVPNLENHYQVCSIGFHDVFDTLSIRRSAGCLAFLRAHSMYCLRLVVAWKIRSDFTLQSAAQDVIVRYAITVYILSSA